MAEVDARTRPAVARRTTSLLLAAATALAVLGSTSSAGAADGQGLPTAAISIGDSYISGEGGRWAGNSSYDWRDRRGTDRAAQRRWWGWSYDADRVYGASDDNGCHRSDVAEIVSADLDVDVAINLACSGATTDNVVRAANGGRWRNGEAPQADQLAQLLQTHDAEVVVVSIGGNDLGFAEIVGGCAAAYVFRLGPCNSWQQVLVDGREADARAGMVAAVRDVQAVLAEAGDDARVVLQSYPAPVGGEIRYGSRSARISTGGCPIYDADARWSAQELRPQITQLVADVAAETGVELLDVSAAFDGKQVCAPGVSQSDGSPTSADQEWVRMLVTGFQQGEAQESYHPNAFGQQALGTCLRSHVAVGGLDTSCVRTGATATDLLAEPLG